MRNKGMISLPTAVIVYCLLSVAAVYALNGPARTVVLLVIVLLAAKSCIHYFRDRLD